MLSYLQKGLALKIIFNRLKTAKMFLQHKIFLQFFCVFFNCVCEKSNLYLDKKIRYVIIVFGKTGQKRGYKTVIKY